MNHIVRRQTVRLPTTAAAKNDWQMMVRAGASPVLLSAQLVTRAKGSLWKQHTLQTSSAVSVATDCCDNLYIRVAGMELGADPNLDLAVDVQVAVPTSYFSGLLDNSVPVNGEKQTLCQLFKMVQTASNPLLAFLGLVQLCTLPVSVRLVANTFGVQKKQYCLDVYQHGEWICLPFDIEGSVNRQYPLPTFPYEKAKPPDFDEWFGASYVPFVQYMNKQPQV